MPRLRKGEMAGGVKAKSVAVQNNVKRRIEIFNDLISMQQPSSEQLDFFRSAENLASWNDESMGIFSVSVKTLRKHVDDIYPDGLAALCASARMKLAEKTVQQNQNKTTDYKRKASLAIDSALEMTARYLDLLERMKRMTHHSKEMELELVKHLRRYGQHPHIKEVI